MGSDADKKIVAMKRNMKLAYVLWLLLGFLGLHRFYCRKPFGWVYILLWLLGFCTARFGIGFLFLSIVGIWWVVDAFLIYQWIEKYNLNLVSSIEQQNIINKNSAEKIAADKTKKED